MVTPIKVQVRDNGTFAYLRGVSDRAKKIPPIEAWNLTQFGAREVKESHERTSERFRRKISAGIQARKLGRNKYGIFIPIEGIWLDRMSPHWVSIKRGRLIFQWAKERGINAKAIKVNPHPFVDAGFRRMVNRLDIVANRIANKIVGV